MLLTVFTALLRTTIIQIVTCIRIYEHVYIYILVYSKTKMLSTLWNDSNVCYILIYRGELVAKLVGALRHKTGGPGFDTVWDQCKFSSNPIPLSTFSRPGIHSAANRNEYQGTSLGLKCGRRIQLTTLPSWLC